MSIGMRIRKIGDRMLPALCQASHTQPPTNLPYLHPPRETTFNPDFNRDFFCRGKKKGEGEILLTNATKFRKLDS